jgi:hypothetical protein
MTRRTILDLGPAAVLALAAGLSVIPLMILPAGPASAAPVGSPTIVAHDVTFTASWDDDICGLRANTTTYHRKIEQVQVFERSDGTFVYRDVAVVTYESDYVDPALPDLSGRLTEVNHLILTPGAVVVAVTTYHDFFGDIRIFYRLHATEKDGELVVVREVDKVTGCP